MTTNEEIPQKKDATAESEITAIDVVKYLRKNKKFFREHPVLLSELSLSGSSGNIISLAERQMQILRERNEQTTEKLYELIEIACRNGELTAKIHQVILSLVGTQDLEDTFHTLYESLSSNMDADCAAVRIFAKPAYVDSFSGTEFCAKDSKIATSFKTVIENRFAVCGQMTDMQQELLFCDKAGNIASSVLLPLLGKGWNGVLAIGSFDAQRFQTGMGVDLLVNMTEFLVRILAPRIAVHND